MPIKKVGDHWEVGDKEYDTEEKANAAYQAMVALKFDVPAEKKVKKTKKSKKKKADAEEDEDEHDHSGG